MFRLNSPSNCCRTFFYFFPGVDYFTYKNVLQPHDDLESLLKLSVSSNIIPGDYFS